MNLKFPGLIAIAPTKTALVIGSTAAIRPRILYYSASTDGVPGSNAGLDFQIRRCTALGTSTAVTPKSNDPSDEGLAFVVTGGSNCTVEPTYVGFIIEDVPNPQTLVRWSAYDPADEYILPATAAAGIGFQIQAAGGAVGNWKVNATVRQ